MPAKTGGFRRGVCDPMLIAGVDEAGRGPWAGPVVAAAVILRGPVPTGLNDSKKLSPGRREALFAALMASECLIGVGQASVAEIDALNILQANHLAMTRAVELLEIPPDFVLVDGNRLPPWRWPARAIVGGDGLEPAISAASIVAKVTRDRIMAQLDVQHPGYGWADNQGYGTARHRAGLELLGITPHHRRSFAPIKAIIAQSGG